MEALGSVVDVLPRPVDLVVSAVRTLLAWLWASVVRTVQLKGVLKSDALVALLRDGRCLLRLPRSVFSFVAETQTYDWVLIEDEWYYGYYWTQFGLCAVLPDEAKKKDRSDDNLSLALGTTGGSTRVLPDGRKIDSNTPVLLRFLVGAFRVKEFLAEVTAAENAEAAARYRARRETFVVQNDEVKDLLAFVDEWWAAREWFAEKRIRHRLGVVLHGPPGSGKSRVADVLTARFNGYQHKVVFSPENCDFAASMGCVTFSGMHVVLIDDMDRLVHGDQILIPGVKWTFADLLGQLQELPLPGISRQESVILLITVNDLSKLDPAVAQPQEDGRASRPGRVDKIVYVGPMSADGRRAMAGRLLAEWPGVADRAVAEGEGETVAQFELRCKDLAVALMWRDRRLA